MKLTPINAENWKTHGGVVFEKEGILNKAVEEQYILLFEHDHQNECCTVKHTVKGVRLNESFALDSI
ncbi:MAG: hypothetical protein K9I94_02280 [Bacteroidales bacterium]|nr:hypothetical protein [Bacteroidales bacterium]